MNAEYIKEILESKYDSDSLRKYLSFDIAIRNLYQSLHWGTNGENFYEDHLLFERLYNEIAEEVDGLAEKFIGIDSHEIACPIKISKDICDIYENLISDFKITGDPNLFIEHAMFVEKSFLKISESFYDALEEDGLLTMGLDDLLTAIYSKHEDNIYLLKQRYVSKDTVGDKEEESSEE
jgi:DNA-binding ferritin-like protein